MIDNKKYDWSNEKILIADDDIYSFLLLQKVLNRTGASILHAQNGKEALQKLLKDRDISIAILDIVMPFISGIDVVAHCRTMLPDTIFVAFTADVIRYDKKRCQEAGFNLCITKPILPVKFLNALEEAVLIRNQPLRE
jgi:two-component system sensor histidine kinase/response regulator